MNDLDKCRGCLIGGAVGDALGYPVEFMPLSAIKEKYGENGITEYELQDGVARISDDTQMTLFTATGLLLGETRGCVRGLAGPPWSYVWLSYKDWYRTQTEKYPMKGDHFSWLDDIPELFSRRAPGNTCMSVLAAGKEGSVENPINDSKGCGGVMRVAPIGLHLSEGKNCWRASIMKIGAETAALTHGHPLGYIPAAALSYLISLLAHTDMQLEDAVDEMCCKTSCEYGDGDEQWFYGDFRDLIDKARFMAEDKRINDQDAISELGEGWVAEEALAIAIFCALRYSNDFEKAIITAVNHDGDSDSTGAITGNILGVYLGISKIPERFLKNLELKDIIIEIADDLSMDCPLDSWKKTPPTEEEKRWENKYWHNNKNYEY